MHTIDFLHACGDARFCHEDSSGNLRKAWKALGAADSQGGFQEAEMEREAQLKIAHVDP